MISTISLSSAPPLSTRKDIHFSDYITKRFPSIHTGRNNRLLLNQAIVFEHSSIHSFLSPFTHLDVTIPENISNELKLVKNDDLKTNQTYKVLNQTDLKGCTELTQRLKAILSNLCKFISDKKIIPLSEQEIILQKETNNVSQHSGKFEWHLDFFEDYFMQIKHGGTVPIFPHLFFYTGVEFEPTETTFLPKGVQLNQFRNLKHISNYLNSENPTIIKKKGRCQLLSNDILHRAPCNRSNNFILIGVRSIKEKQFFDRINHYFKSNKQNNFNERCLPLLYM